MKCAMKIIVRQVVRRAQSLSRMPKVMILICIITMFAVTANASYASTAREILNLSVNRLVAVAFEVFGFDYSGLFIEF